MSKILGLDIGTTSIGWALLDNEKNAIIRTGVRVFPEGVNRDTKGGEISKNQTRRAVRQARKLNFRRKLKRKKLIEVLRQNNMYPENPADLKLWFAYNPYELRATALDKQLSLLEIGRIFYHLNQRRGFKSSRKNISDEENKGIIYKGNEKLGKTGINKTAEAIGSKHSTLGKYLYSLHPHNKPYKNRERIRNRYTLREMYIKEFDEIWKSQSRYYPEIMNDELKQRIGDKDKGILFFQRPLKSQKYLIGKCTFEKNKPRCPVSSIPYEQYRMLQFINNIEIISPDGEIIKLNGEQRSKLEKLFNSKEKFNFSAIIQNLGYSSEYRFNFDEDHQVMGNPTICSLIKVFGEDKWNSFTDKEKEDIWHNLFFADDRKWLEGEVLNDTKYHHWAEKVKKWNLNSEQLKKLGSIRLKRDYASLSRKAILNILPFLRDGYKYPDAVLLGGVKNAFAQNWYSLTDAKKEILKKEILNIAHNNKEGNSLLKIKEYLKANFQLNEKQLAKLYHHSHPDDPEKPLLDFLPDLENLRNPIVQQALFELKKLVNAIIAQYGLPDEIRVELARELKASKRQREKIMQEIKENEKLNDKAKRYLETHQITPTKDSIIKYRLWEECNRTCPYTGKTINFEDLFNTGRFQIEHIIPWSVSLNDSMNNKTLCDADENRRKGNRTPYQFYSNDPKRWTEIKARAARVLPPNKYKMFIREEECALDDFVSRQLNDTRYISRKAKEYLSSVCKKTYVSTGRLTSHLRYYWGLNQILNTEENEKTRGDHRQHAIDAIVVALTTHAHLQQLSQWNKYQKIRDGIPPHHFPQPWKHFFEDVRKAVLNILVSYKNDYRILSTRVKKTKINNTVFKNKGIAARGSLHEETIYGKKTDSSGKTYFTVRKPLVELTPAMIANKIVDFKVRMLIWERVRQMGYDPALGKYEKNKVINFFTDPIYLPNKNGDPVPIKKVRIKINTSNVFQLKNNINQWVEPGNNDHIVIFERPDGRRDGDVVSFFEAVKRKLAKQPVIDKNISKGKYIDFLRKGDMVLLNKVFNSGASSEEISDCLYVVRKISVSGNNKTITLAHHAVTNVNLDKYQFDPEKEKIPKVVRTNPNTMNFKKVKILVLGEISGEFL